MLLAWHRLPLFLALHCACVLSSTPQKRTYDTHDYFVLEHAYYPSLDTTARALGLEVIEQVGQLEGHWLVRTEKRHARRDLESVKTLTRQILRRRVKRVPPEERQEEPISSQRATAQNLGIADPLFPDQWHLINDVFPEHSMNVTGVWDMGLTGQGVISSLLDDGLDYSSGDLADNFDADNSHDYNDHVDLPTPKLYDDNHGTRCAGQIAAVKNDLCGVGIAYESKVAGVRILSGDLTDADEAAALNFGYQNVSIYSCSWGPPDDGRTMEGPSVLIRKAMLNGINKGRDGKGSVFVFASGNGASHGDQCNFDGYTNSIYSVTVSAVDHQGLHPYYSEPCAANMIVAYSSGNGKSIVTTDRGDNKCATTHGGTSAAAPNAVGVFALAMQARPDLTWRDIQYLCVQTARLINPDDPDWERTAAGRLYSYKYGFGALDAYAFVTAAQDWQIVKPQTWMQTPVVQVDGGKMDEAGHFSGGAFITEEGVTSTLDIAESDLVTHNLESLEHVNVKVWIGHSRRGDVGVELVSPNGITSVLASQRKGDVNKDGFPGWTFMTVKHWAENPVGTWTIKVIDPVNPESNGTFVGWSMLLWGSTIDASQAKLYNVPPDDEVFPPPEDIADNNPPPTTTTIYTKPTEHLPDDHGDAEGENSNPAFSSGAATSTASPTSAPYGETGWIPGMASMVKNQKWLFGSIAVVGLFGIGVGVFFWRRRVARRQREANYSSLPEGENVLMSALDQGRTRELYDAFGEISDDEDAELLKDSDRDDERKEEHGERYRDEPLRRSGSQEDVTREGSASSADGSWVHTS